MKIGIIGAGDVAQALAKPWAQAEHSIMLSSRHPENLEELAKSLNVHFGSVKEAAQFGDILILAVSYWTVDEAIDQIRPEIEGKLVIDTTNPLKWRQGGGTERVIADHLIAGEVMQEKIPEARIAKAFTTLWTGFLRQHAHATPRVAMTLAADVEADRHLVAGLIVQVGFEPVDLGTLGESRPLDPPSPIWNVVLTANELLARVATFRATL